MKTTQLKDLTVFALDTLLEYAKFLEDHKMLTYDLLKQRVDTYRNEPVTFQNHCPVCNASPMTANCNNAGCDV